MKLDLRHPPTLTGRDIGTTRSGHERVFTASPFASQPSGRLRGVHHGCEDAHYRRNAVEPFTDPVLPGILGAVRGKITYRVLVLAGVALVAMAVFVPLFGAQIYAIPGGSMESTLHGCTGCSNDRILIDKTAYLLSDPEPGQIVVFRRSDATYVGRIIALGGQTVRCCDSTNRVEVGGDPLDEPYLYYLPEAGRSLQEGFGPVTLPAEQLWIMGDSRNNAADSRTYGPVAVDDLIGRARFVVLPLNRLGAIE